MERGDQILRRSICRKESARGAGDLKGLAVSVGGWREVSKQQKCEREEMGVELSEAHIRKLRKYAGREDRDFNG